MKNLLPITTFSLILPLAASAAYNPAAFTDFWRDNDGKTIRRIPVNVMPENVFWGLGTRDFADGMKTFNRLMDESFAKSTYNCITLTLRCNPELGDAETIAAAKACCARAHQEGVKVYMDTDPRIARREFFAKWPTERQSLANVVSATPTNGLASFTTKFLAKQDHMSWGSKSMYRPLNGKVLSASSTALRSASRPTSTTPVDSLSLRNSNPTASRSLSPPRGSSPLAPRRGPSLPSLQVRSRRWKDLDSPSSSTSPRTLRS